MYPYDYLKQNDYLIHHGILGQKWGVRRFQNEDGSLTPAGKQRKKMDDKTKDYIKKGALATASVLLVIGAYKAPKIVHNVNRKLVLKGVKKIKL